MKLIIGLGNPGKEYEHTHHNVGFATIDLLAEKWNIPLNQQKFNALYGMAHRPEGKVMLLKPLTYMNLSGEAVRPMMDYFDVDVEDIVVIYDDLDLEKGKLRLRQKGSAGGHNGIKSLIQHIGTQNFNRIRIGKSSTSRNESARLCTFKILKRGTIIDARCISSCRRCM